MIPPPTLAHRASFRLPDMSDSNGCEKASVATDISDIQYRAQLSKRKQHKKLVRLLTVMAYVFSVSLGAIVLSLYYVFLWDPQIQRDGTGAERQRKPGPLPRAHALSGGAPTKRVGGLEKNESGSSTTEDGSATVRIVKVKGKW